MAKFKVGDRVMASQTVDGELPCGVGPIVSDDLQFCVYFPEWASQHQGHSGLGGGDSYGHWFYPIDTECLKLVSEKPDTSERDQLAREFAMLIYQFDEGYDESKGETWAEWISDICNAAFDLAEAFLAERAKRTTEN